MTDYPYLEKTAINPVAPITIARSASFSVYDLNDVGYLTPLNVTRLSDGATVTSLLSDSNGYLPDFTVLDRVSVVIRSASGFTKTLVTSAPIPGAPGAAGAQGDKGDKGDPGDVSTWATPVWYPLGTPVVNPSGDLVVTTTAHTSGANYDPSKFGPPPITAGKVNKGELVFNVKDYGAKGDGATDDTAAIQSAMNAVGAAGGGTLFFPPGEYYMNTYVTLCDNVTITGKGATIRKLGSSYSYVCFASFSGANKGYGSGANNVTCHGLKFRGSFNSAAPRGLCAFSLHHARNFLAYNLRFTECSGQGHQFDCGGADGVTVRDCLFEGFRTEWGDLYNECVQIDYSARISSSVPDADTAYDGLPSKNFLVENNRFVSLTIGATTYPAPIPVGSHSISDGSYYTNITVRGNYIETPFTDTTSSIVGIFHFYGHDGLRIENNTIVNTNAALTYGIFMSRANVVMPLSTVTDPNATSIVTTNARVPKNVRIIGNTFTGFKTTSTTYPIIGIYGDRGYNQAENITVDGNVFKDCHEANLDANSGQVCINITDAIRVTANENKGSTIRRLVELSYCTQGTVNANGITDAFAQTLNFLNCSNFAINDNRITNYNTTAIQILGAGGMEFHIRGNTIKGQRADTAGRAILIRQATQVIANENTIKTTTGTAKGVDVDTASSGMVKDNIIIGFTTPVNVSADSTITQSGTITA